MNERRPAWRLLARAVLRSALVARLDVRVNETTWMVAGWLLAAAIVTPASAARIAVPRDASTIQAAVDIAAPGDTIVVGPGVYAENVRLRAGDDGLTIAAADGNTGLSTLPKGVDLVFIPTRLEGLTCPVVRP